MVRWNADPILLKAGALQLRWYGLFFAISFMLGHRLTLYLFGLDRVPTDRVDKLFMYVVAGTVIGARLGHCLFYEPDVYLADPLRILKVWEGGLASHGAAIGIIFSLYLFCRKYREFDFRWLLDRLSVPVAFAGGFIRLGNLFNSEIIGRPTDVPWAFVFERVDQLPRHPTQLYESILYFAIATLLFQMSLKERFRKARGLIFGLFMVLVFGARFVLEFFKEEQVAFERGLVLDMGQLLSIPAVLVGAILIYSALSRMNSRSN